MNKKILSAVIGTIILLASITGCGSQPSTQDTKQQTQIDSTKSANEQLSKAIQSELNGFITIEQDVNKGNFKDAATIADQLHNEFHAAILSPLKEKKGESYAEDIHGKYDELQDAVKDQDTTKILNLIKVNRENLSKIADILGVTIIQK